MKNLPGPSKYELSEEQHRKIAAGREMLASPVASEETLIWHGRPSWVRTFFGLIISAGFGFAWYWVSGKLSEPGFLPQGVSELLLEFEKQGTPPEKILQWAAYVCYFFVALCILGFLKKLLRQLRTTYTVTSQRVIVKSGGLFSVNAFQVELFRLKDFVYNRGFLGSLFGFATITLVSSGPVAPVVKLIDITDAAQKVDAIRRASQLARAESGKVSISE